MAKKVVKKVRNTPKLRDRIVRALKRRKKGATTDQLAKLVGSKTSSVSSACSRAAKDGVLVRTDGGKGRGTEAVYVLAETAA